MQTLPVADEDFRLEQPSHPPRSRDRRRSKPERNHGRLADRAAPKLIAVPARRVRCPANLAAAESADHAREARWHRLLVGTTKKDDSSCPCSMGHRRSSRCPNRYSERQVRRGDCDPPNRHRSESQLQTFLPAAEALHPEQSSRPRRRPRNRRRSKPEQSLRRLTDRAAPKWVAVPERKAR